MEPETAAFAPLTARSDADPADRIFLRDHVVVAEIGAFAEERGRRQRLSFDVVVEVADTGPAGDDVDRILSYDTITRAIAEALSGGRINLLETLAEAVAGRVLSEPRARRVFLRIAKLDRGPGTPGVEVVRGRGDLPAAGTGGGPAPAVVLLGPAAAASPKLAGWLDGLLAAGLPPVLVPPLPASRVDAQGATAARRIALLALEQAAWALAERDPRLAVAASRTELGWAVEHLRPVVWAPGKLVLDAPRGAAADPFDPPALAAWLARELGAARLICVGAPLPDAGAAPGLTLDARDPDAAQLT